MDPEFWRGKWLRNEIGFHEDHTHPMLERYWPGCAVAPPATVFVPLCGKSNDLCWLRQAGHEVIGVELSDIAVRAFFDENGLVASVDHTGPFGRYRATGVTLLHGDFFALTPEILGPVAAVYDRASLIALTPDMRRAYARHLSTLCRADTVLLLITLQYPQGAIGAPPFAVTDAEVGDLYASWCAITRLGCGPTMAKGVACEQTAHKLVARAGQRAPREALRSR